MTRLTVEMPDDLVEAAGSRGLLTSEAIGAMIREQLARRAGAELLDAAKRLASARFPSMKLAEIQAEVDAVRVQRAGGERTAGRTTRGSTQRD